MIGAGIPLEVKVVLLGGSGIISHNMIRCRKKQPLESVST